MQVPSTTSHIIGLIETVTGTWLSLCVCVCVCVCGGVIGGGSSSSGAASWLTVARRTPDRLVYLTNMAIISVPAVQKLLFMTTVENPTYNASLIC